MDERKASQIKRQLLASYTPVHDGGQPTSFINASSWWGNGEILSSLGELIAHPFTNVRVTKIIGPASSGHLLGALTAVHLQVGLIAAVKDPQQAVDGDTWLRVTTPPDYRDRHVVFGIRRDALSATDSGLGVDDVADTGSQLTAMKRLVEAAGAQWVGASVLVDLIAQSATRRALGLSTAIHSRELPL